MSPSIGPRILVPWELSSPKAMSPDVRVYPGVAAPPPSELEAVEMYVLPYELDANSGRSPAIELIGKLPSLRVLQTLTAGYDHLRELIPATVTLCNGRGLHDASAAEHALGLILAAQRQIPRWVHDQARGRWETEYTRSLAGSTVLIIGHGAIGTALAARLEACEARVLKLARRARPADDVHGPDQLDRLLPHADVAVLVVPFEQATHHLVGAAELALLGDDALVVNISRGPVLDTAAAKREMNRLRFALDVTDPEPLPPGHPFWTCDRVLMTPHVAGGSATFRPRARHLIDDQVQRFRTGQPLLNIVRQGL